MACNGLKVGSFCLFVHRKWSRIIFGKTHFWPIFDPFLVPKQPSFKAFWDFRRAKTGHHEPKTRQKHLFWHSIRSTIIFETSHFFCTPWTLLNDCFRLTNSHSANAVCLKQLSVVTGQPLLVDCHEVLCRL